jgi:hypothetical protein
MRNEAAAQLRQAWPSKSNNPVTWHTARWSVGTFVDGKPVFDDLRCWDG